MDINVENKEDERLDITNALNHIDNILKSGNVSVSDIVQLETLIDTESFPSYLKNKVSSVASKHGYDDLLRYLENNTNYNQLSNASIDINLIYKTVSVVSDNYNTIVAGIEKDLYSTINKLYVPDNVSNMVQGSVSNLGELPVSYLTSNGAAVNVYRHLTASASPVVSYLRTTSYPVGVGLIDIVVNFYDNCMCLKDDSVAIETIFTGTVEQLLLKTLNSLVNNSKSILDAKKYIINHREELLLYGKETISYNNQHLSIAEINKVLTSDKLIYSYID